MDKPDKSSAAFHQASWNTFHEFMDSDRFGTMLLLLRERDLPSSYARHQAGMDIVDILSCGIYNGDYQTLLVHSRELGDHLVPLKHTYKYWAQVVTLNEFLQAHYGLKIPRLSRPKKENGLLTCIELDDNHECYLRDRYIVRTFRLRPRKTHRCPEETAAQPVNSTVATMENKKETVCAYCLAEKLNINL